MTEQLDTVSAVVDKLGGTKAVASLFKLTDPAVSNWRKTGQFPPYTYIPIRDALQKIDKSAPDSLWGWATAEAAQ